MTNLWTRPLTPAFGKQRQGQLCEFENSPGLYSELKANQDYVLRLL